jgi:hypothetical protein
MSSLMDEVTGRWDAMFRQLAAGDDAPPSQRLRLEGLMEALVITGEYSPQAVQAAMDHSYRTVFGQDLAAALGGDWQTLHPFPQIPAFMRRAPVYPSTSD